MKIKALRFLPTGDYCCDAFYEVLVTKIENDYVWYWPIQSLSAMQYRCHVDELIFW
jgi:hypothetical protein